jgi:hypothetical protein
LDAHFDVREICPELGYLQELLPPEKRQQLGKNLAEVLQDYRLIRGHFRYEKLRNWLGDRALFLTVLRDPVDRVLSLYEFYKRDLERGDEKRLDSNVRMREATQGGIIGFVQHSDPEVMNRTVNGQVRQLAAYDRGKRELSDEELLEQAKQNLEQCAVVGLTERFQDSVFLLAYTFGWYPYTDYQSLRVAKRKSRKDSLDAKTLAAIEQANQLDLALYEYGQTLFEQRFRTMLSALEQTYGAPTQGTLPEPAALSELLERHYEQRYERSYAASQPQVSAPIPGEPPPPLPQESALHFSFRQPIPGTGWHRRNGRFNGILTKGSDTFCWSGPTPTSTLDFPLKPDQDLTIRVRIVSAAAPDILTSLQLQVNQHPVPLAPLLQRGNITVVHGTIPKSALETSLPFTRLVFLVNRTLPFNVFSPGQTDKRLIGLAFHSLQLFPVGSEPELPPDTNFLFPADEPAFVEVADFLETHLKPEETLIAPPEFAEPFPQAFHNYAHPKPAEAPISWVVLHRNYLNEVEPAVLHWTVNRLKPVFSNRILTVFSGRSQLPSAKLLSRNMMVFWLKYWRFRLVGKTR